MHEFLAGKKHKSLCRKTALPAENSRMRMRNKIKTNRTTSSHLSSRHSTYTTGGKSNNKKVFFIVIILVTLFILCVEIKTNKNKLTVSAQVCPHHFTF